MLWWLKESWTIRLFRAGVWLCYVGCVLGSQFFFFFSSRRRHTRCREVSWARRCVQETGINAEYMGHGFYPLYFFSFLFYFVGTVNFNFIFKMFVKYQYLRKPWFYILQGVFMNVSSNYFAVLFGMILLENCVIFSRGVIWIPILHGMMFLLIQLLDKKDPKLRLDYPRYSRMKIYEAFKPENELLC
eukprot:TRINITY_DN21626_c0_g1_i2.p1 TRINITY_DN21626_c0_g1~~TRINITY_DN21626_c0_g1_i2.p1  ORF type:complete len:187 (-),score=36.83 TRINITY_DN21626_c0_g1_i2:50-610(-)